MLSEKELNKLNCQEAIRELIVAAELVADLMKLAQAADWSNPEDAASKEAIPLGHALNM